MADILDHNDEQLPLKTEDLFTEIWFSPRRVFKHINDNHYNKHVIILLILSGIARALDRASTKNMGDKMSMLGI